MDSVELLRAGASSHSWTTRLFFICSLSLFVASLYKVCSGFYNVFLHPLRKYPGPKTWIAFPIFRHIASLRGVLDRDLIQLHEKYGPAVRFSENQLSFINAQAWKDIYGHGHRQLPKFFQPIPGRASDIINANDADHTRFRKALAHGFSEKALAQQETLLADYINLLFEKLRDVAIAGQKADMVNWYNLTTFDLIGDLSFGTSFEGLKNNQLHGWISMIFQGVKAGTYVRTAQKFPLAKPLLYAMAGGFLKARAKHLTFVRDTAMRRVHSPDLNGRGDFMDSMQRHKGEPGGLSEEELVSNANILVLAGSETTATLLSGVTYLLLKNQHCLHTLTEEVRGAFEREDEINFLNASSRLPYMLACLNEALRMYPPVPTGLERVVPAGVSVEICGEEIPSGTQVSVHQSAAYHSPTNFAFPENYCPDRWLNPTPARFLDDDRAVFQPFSTGPRNCIGRNLAYNEMRLILARLVWNFDLELCPESDGWMDQKTWILWEKPALYVKLTLRKGVEA